MLISFRAKLCASLKSKFLFQGIWLVCVLIRSLLDIQISTQGNPTAMSFSLCAAESRLHLVNGIPVAATESTRIFDPTIDPAQQGLVVPAFATNSLAKPKSPRAAIEFVHSVHGISPSPTANSLTSARNQISSLGCVEQNPAMLPFHNHPRSVGGTISDDHLRCQPHEHRTHGSLDQKSRSVSLPRDISLLAPLPSPVEWDFSIGLGNIKVLSRTLFVSGIASESHLRSLFENFGVVQTCVVNRHKCHAFIKMLRRQDAVKAHTGADWFDSDEIRFRTRWGVGFGPHQCSDYRTGVSIIPLGRLTGADRKCLVASVYGGTGGLPPQSGMVIEEPDTEIGTGISSKAFDRMMATAGAKHGQRQGRVQSRGGSRTGPQPHSSSGRSSKTHLRRHW